MVKENANKPHKGYWDNLKNERTPKVNFEVNIVEEVTFNTNEPREDLSQDGESVYYTFEVSHKGVDTVIQTSAFTLLAELKKHEPLLGKTLFITKKIDKGKQYFTVTT